MDDRELIDLAAKAAGVPLKWPHDPATYARVDGVPPRRTDTWDNWNPLTDDGDALRLAVNLRIQVPVIGGGMHSDKYVATRRAIVEAAAALATAPAA